MTPRPTSKIRTQSNLSAKRHFLIPDTQIRPGVPLDHLDWIAEYLVERRPNEVIHLGDHWDFPSLNGWEKPGSFAMEGLRFSKDVEAGNAAWKRLFAPMEKAIALTAKTKRPWKPNKRFLMGNHEDRADRVAAADPRWMGHVGTDHCLTPGFVRSPFLEIVWVDGIAYCHYFQNSHSKFAIGGSIDNRLNKIGASFVQGHEQGKREGARIMASGRTLYGLVAGSCYLHVENYRGRQGQRHWRGVVVLNEVDNGEYDIMPVSLKYLCRKYEGLTLEEYMNKKYRDGDWRHLA